MLDSLKLDIRKVVEHIPAWLWSGCRIRSILCRQIVLGAWWTWIYTQKLNLMPLSCHFEKAAPTEIWCQRGNVSHTAMSRGYFLKRCNSRLYALCRGSLLTGQKLAIATFPWNSTEYNCVYFKNLHIKTTLLNIPLSYEFCHWLCVWVLAVCLSHTTVAS